ncbi:MAG: glycosyltransferase [Candidatus Margulisiibacteriota bacterium]|nr:MAG: glycosyltransferase [Candidatus Margulisiibacteriota bacterium]
MKISICIPVYNGSETIVQLVAEVIDRLGSDLFEIILVNDGSKDNSEFVCTQLANSNKLVKFISLRKNFGEHNAVMCALNYVAGDCAVIIDDDFQNPPDEIMKLVIEASNGYDVVYSYYEKKKHHWFRNLGSAFNDYVATQLIGKPRDLYLSSFKLISRDVVTEIIKYKGPFPYIDGLLLRATNNIGKVMVNHFSRREGVSNYTLSKLASLWLNMFINFSIKPLRLFIGFGMLVALLSFILLVNVVFEKIQNPGMPLGWASTTVLILFFSGVQIVFMGLIGEYIGKSYLDQNNTPQWVIKNKINCAE